jgi:hypothetical protein
MKASEEQIYREQVRQDLIQEQSKRIDQEQQERKKNESLVQEADRRRILGEERRAFFAGQEGFIEVQDENRESEWITLKQWRDREGYLDYEDLVENPEHGRRYVMIRLVLAAIVFLVAMSAAYWYMSEELALVHIVSDPPGCHIWVDGQDSGFITNCEIELAIGEHLIEVDLTGYTVQEPSLRHLMLSRNDEVLLEFSLRPLAPLPLP